MKDSIVWTIVEYDEKGGPGIIQSPDGIIELEFKPTTINQILRVLASARMEDEDHRPYRGWRTREQISQLISMTNGYGPETETISRYVTNLMRGLEIMAIMTGVELPPLIERRRKLGMRLADRVRLRWVSVADFN